MKNSEKIILHLCADIGSDSQPYKDNGYDVRLIGSDVGVENYHPPGNVYGIIANPVCTMFSRARTTAKTPRDMKKGMFLVQECLRVIWESQYYKKTKHTPYKLKFWCIENPGSGYLKHFLGFPRYTYDPYQYGEDYTKNTSLWGYFNIPQETNPFGYPPVCKRYISKLPDGHKIKPKDRPTHKRSMCCKGFAKAFFHANQ